MGNELHNQAERYGSSRVVVGMVDNDKRLSDIPKLRPFNEVVLRCDEPGSMFVVYRHQALPTHYLIVLHPACDAWIYGAAQAAGISPATHGLPAALPDFLIFTKKILAEERPEIVALLKALRRSPSPAYAQLLAFINERLQDANQPVWP
ncbi:MAG: hypothetical protein H7Z21_09570 [Hymenobacter sp.]|nr:hypothetical protein [Hymenobacter sp.]